MVQFSPHCTGVKPELVVTHSSGNHGQVIFNFSYLIRFNKLYETLQPSSHLKDFKEWHKLYKFIQVCTKI